MSVTTVGQVGYYLVRKPGEEPRCEYGDSPRAACKLAFGEVLRGKRGEWKFIGQSPLAMLGGERLSAALSEQGWNRMDNRGTYIRTEKTAQRDSPGREDEPWKDDAGIYADNEQMRKAIESHLERLRQWADRMKRIHLLSSAKKIWEMANELETESGV